VSLSVTLCVQVCGAENRGGGQEAEASLARLIVDKTVHGRIDRPAGIVDFRPPQDANGVLTAWSSSVDTLLGLVELTSHLIAKEEMVHGAKSAAPAAAS
jgi:hypothetical protein